MIASLLALSLAQPYTGPRPGAGAFLSVPAAQTTAALALYVEPTGSDSNACTASGASACLTFPAACAKVPHLVRHPVIITGAAGSFTTLCDLEGYQFAPADPANGAYIWIHGTPANVTPTTGSATATVTSYAAAANAAGSHPVFTFTAPGWTVSDFKRKFLVITGGTCNGAVMAIVDNTATTITTSTNAIASLQTSAGCTPDNTSTIAIQDPATTITGQLTLSKAGPANITQFSQSAASTNFASMIVAGTQREGASSTFSSTMPGGSVYITNFLFSGAITPLFVDHAAGVIFAQNRLAGAKVLQLRQAQSAGVYTNTASLNSAGSWLVQADFDDRTSGATATISDNVIDTGGLVRSRSGSGSLILRGNTIRGNTSAAVTITSAARYEDLHNDYQPAGAGCVSLGAPGNSTTYGYGVAEIGDFYCTGATGGIPLDVTGDWKIQGTALVSNAWTITGGAGTSAAIRLNAGAILMYPSGSTVTANAGAAQSISIGQNHTEDYFSDAQLTTAGGMIASLTGTCISNNSASSCNATNVGPWLSYRDGNIGRGPILKLAAIPTASLPTSSTANGALTTGSIVFDSTLGCFTGNNGTAWTCLDSTPAATSVYSASQIASGLGSGKDFADAIITNASTLQGATFTPQVVGVGAGNATYSLCNGQGACTTAFATCTFSCTAAVGARFTCSVGTAAIPAGTDANWRIVTSCATDPVGVAAAVLTQP